MQVKQFRNCIKVRTGLKGVYLKLKESGSLLKLRSLKKYKNNLRKRLKNDNFTILASNCAAGIIYNRLGKHFLSPIINMWFRQADYIKFCINYS